MTKYDGAVTLDTRMYFGKLSVLVLESNALERDILTQVLAGFKVRSLRCCTGAVEAQALIKQDPADLVIVGHASEDAGSFRFIRWLRRTTSDATRTCPVILLTAHTLQQHVMLARDCGANLVIAKPVRPEVLYERIRWLGQDERPFITSAKFSGPDRRFQMLGPPSGTDGNRGDDLSLNAGNATEPNMSQQEIDAMLNFRKAGV